MTINEIKAKLKKLADQKKHSDRDDFMPDDCAGGNIDDAFYGGWHDGEISLARSILKDLEKLS